MESIPEAWSWSVHSPAGPNIAAVVSLGTAETYNVVACVVWGYDGGTPTAGSLVITDGITTITVPIVDKGPGKLELTRPFVGAADTGVTITLAAGGEGVTGKLNVQHR